MSSDTLSTVLRAVRLTGAVFFSTDASAPWVADTPVARELGPYVSRGSSTSSTYNFVTSGSCYGGIVDEPALRLEAGTSSCFRRATRTCPARWGLPANHEPSSR
jgi:hypothetical protein